MALVDRLKWNRLSKRYAQDEEYRLTIEREILGAYFENILGAIGAVTPVCQTIASKPDSTNGADE